MGKESIKLEGLDLIRETENAILFDYEGEKYWLPKSRIKVEATHEGYFNVHLPEWLATEKGMI